MPKGDAKMLHVIPPVDRVLARCTEDERGCWVWPGATGGRGDLLYGRITVGSRRHGTRRTTGTHQVTYDFFIGEVPEGYQLDHYVCQNTRCCNPWHLEAVPAEINRLRAYEKQMQKVAV